MVVFDGTKYSELASRWQVPNYLPSISAAIGDHAPQKYIWRIAIALHALPRMRLALIYYQYYKKNPIVVRSFWLTWWNRINSSLHIVENFALLVITYVSSTENFGEWIGLNCKLLQNIYIFFYGLGHFCGVLLIFIFCVGRCARRCFCSVHCCFHPLYAVHVWAVPMDCIQTHDTWGTHCIHEVAIQRRLLGEHVQLALR